MKNNKNIRSGREDNKRTRCTAKPKKLCLCLAAALMLTACSSESVRPLQSASSISFSWWGSDTRSDYTLSAISEFEKENPGISVITEYCGRSGSARRLAVQKASGSEADVVQLDSYSLDKYSPDGEGFYDLYQLDDIIELDNYDKKYLDYGTIGGKLNGIPISMDAVAFYYREEDFEKLGVKIPTTWEELENAGQIMSRQGVYPLETDMFCFFRMTAAYAEQVTGESFCEDGALAADEEYFRCALDMAIRLLDSKAVIITDDSGVSGIKSWYSAGTACRISDAGYYLELAGKDEVSLMLGEQLTQPQAKKSGWYYEPSAFYSIRKDVSQPENAAKLLNFLINGEEMIYGQGLEKGRPLSRSALEVLEANDMLSGIQESAAEQLDENMSDMEYADPFMDDPELLTEFGSALDTVRYGETDTAQAAKELCAKLQLEVRG